MGRQSKDFNEGYQAAIEAIKQALSGQSQSSSGGSGSSGSLDLPSDIMQPPTPDSNSGSEKTRDSAEKGANHGEVRPEDCIGPNSLNDIPSTPGGMMEKSDGDKLAEQEGYDKEGGSDSTVEKEWGDAAKKAARDMKAGKTAGRDKLKLKLEGLWKTATDWKSALRKIVGHSISPEDKRQAYANKNILVSQDRIARTDKDKYDNLDYMMAWIDSSGSMDDDQLKMCLREVYQVALAKKPIKLVVVQCDTQIQEIKEFTSLQQLKSYMIHATVKGRGGTEFKPCWDLLVNDPKYKRRPTELVMLFTDGYLTQYKRNPRTMKNLCWVIIDNPSFNIQYKDINTKMVHINSNDIK